MSTASFLCHQSLGRSFHGNRARHQPLRDHVIAAPLYHLSPAGLRHGSEPPTVFAWGARRWQEFSQPKAEGSRRASSSECDGLPDDSPGLAWGPQSSFKKLALFCPMLAAFAMVAWFQNIGVAGLVDDTEPLFAEAARQMLVTGDWVTPQFNAQPRYDKPALIYWLMAMAGTVLGPSVAAFRLPSAILATVLMVFLAATVRHFGLSLPNMSDQGQPIPKKRRSSLEQALIAAAAFALNFMSVIWGSTALSDMLLMSTMGGCLLAFFLGYASSRKSRQQLSGYLASAFFMGLAVLAKGPIGCVIPVAVVLPFLVYTGELFMVLRELPLLRGAVIVIALTCPWYLAMVARHGGTFLYTFFGYHNLERFARGVNHHHGRPVWYGLAVVLLGYLPWSLCSMSTFCSGLFVQSRRSWQSTERPARLLLFSASWLLSGFAVFAASASQLPSYYLPVAPAIAMLAAAKLAEGGRTAPAKGRGYLSLATFTCCVFTGVALFYGPTLLQQSRDTLAVTMGKSIAAKKLHIVGAVIQSMASIAVLLTKEVHSLRPERAKSTLQFAKPPLWSVLAASSLLLLAMFVTPTIRVVDQVRQLPLRQLAATAATVQMVKEPLVMVGPRMPSVVYYSRQPVAFFDTPEEAMYALQNEAAPGTPSAIILADASQLRGALSSAEVLQEVGTYKLVRVIIDKMLV